MQNQPEPPSHRLLQSLATKTSDCVQPAAASGAAGCRGARTCFATQSGFALIVTLSLMVLLCLIAIGILSFSSVTLRATSRFASQEQARANAKLALMLAIGRVQSLAGPDTRITAPRRPESISAPLDSVAPAHGVWRSWEGTDHEISGSAIGRPRMPDYASKKTSANSGGRFLGWLVSTTDPATADLTTIPDLQSQPDAGLVPLVSDGSVTDPKRRVFLKPTPVSTSNNNLGTFGWWVGGENSKACIAPDNKPTTSDAIAWQERSRAHAVPSPKAFGLANPPDKALPSNSSLILAAIDAGRAKGHFHDATSWANGLLTNAATGGWKRDLSLMTEKYDELPSTGLPFFTLRPGEHQTFSKAAPAQTRPLSHPPNPLLYAWCTYRSSPSNETMAQFPAIVSWDYLRNACIQYRSLIGLSPSAGRTGIPWAISSWWNNSGKQFRYEFLDQQRRWPTVSRIYLMFSYVAVPDPANPNNLKPALAMAPVVVLWNPYNHEITLEGSKKFNINTVNNEMTPTRFAFTIGAAKQNPISLFGIMGANVDFRLNGGLGAEAMTLRPGETRVFSVKDDALVNGESVSGGEKVLNLYPGYRTNGGFYFLKIGTGKTEISAPRDSDFKVDLSFDAQIVTNRKGFGSMLDIGHVDMADPSNGFNRRSSRQFLLFSKQAADALWPHMTAEQLPSGKLSEVLGTNSKLFLTAVIGFRTANDSMIPAKGYLQTNPLNYVSDLADVNLVGIPAANLSGIQHPANSCYDIQFINGADASARPNVEPITNRGYVVSGLDASSGLTSCISAEIPARPIQSLGDLQHLDLRNCNPFPPFQFNITGNSQAHPMLPPSSIVLSPMQHDDAYCLNHLFFDDWFVSCIAPDLRDWTSQTERGLDRVYQDFLLHSKNPASGAPLPNKMFRPTPDAMDADVEKAYERDVKPADSYRNIASKLSVDGMFNVNSTSEAAWRALLGHALGQRQPYFTESGGSWNVSLSPERDNVVSRMSVAGGGAAGIDANPLGTFPGALEFCGHRALTDPQLDALAKEIVKQVRQRGPFLSLSEFINRRLSAASSEEELALAGTVEAALSALASRGSSDPSNPYRELQRNSRQITQATIAAMPALADARYLFPKAAEGWASHGIPGWIRQADVLRPLAPVLSVRDDTFVIRAYGDSRDANGTVIAKAWCEAIIRRHPEFIDPQDAATDTPVLGTDSNTEKFLQSSINSRFGRKFTIVSFRWLNANEI